MNKTLTILSALSSIGMIAWFITDDFGGMFIFFFEYSLVILPLLIIYILTLVTTIFRTIRSGIHTEKQSLLIHCFALISIFGLQIKELEVFKSEMVLSATLYDDLSHIKIDLRKNQKFETTVSGMFGFKEKVKGKYLFKGDTIVFSKHPYKNDYIPKTILMNLEDSSLYFEKSKSGEFTMIKSFAGFFQIEYINEDELRRLPHN